MFFRISAVYSTYKTEGTSSVPQFHKMYARLQSWFPGHVIHQESLKPIRLPVSMVENPEQAHHAEVFRQGGVDFYQIEREKFYI